jgi:hypothetical protein
VKPLSSRVMELFEATGEDRLDLHALFGIAGDGIKERLYLLDAIDELVRAGMLDACGDEFYALTEKAKSGSPA